jgi:hypothetical protein
MFPIIIPPSFFKAMSNYHLLRIWKKAETLLREAKQIIFCGYSFPDADLHIKYLLKRVEVNKSDFERKIYLFLKNPKNQDEPTNPYIVQNYTRFFKHRTAIINTEEPFSTFSEEGFDCLHGYTT